MTKLKGQPVDFIRKIIEDDLASGKHKVITTRFPPEPNGFLHIGHAKSICLNFEVAIEYGGHCRLRMDDTNPLKEEALYVDAIQQDIRWLGFQWHGDVSFASDYFEALYEVAKQLIEQGDAYVDSQSQAAIHAQRGTLTAAGENSPHRNRSPAESLQLFEAMRAGQFADGEQVLRAKIDMASPNINLRDPVLYRIRHAEHQRTGQVWCIYPMYDYTHCLCDAFENITHSLCTLEFENHRPLYEWILAAACTQVRPQQIEFSRLQLEQSMTSKRKLNELIKSGQVLGWDDPRILTLAALKRRGIPAQTIRDFCVKTGVTKKYHTIQMASFEHSVRTDLEPLTPRAFAVLNPVRLIIDNWLAQETVILPAPWQPDEKIGQTSGIRHLGFGRELYIERDDFMLDPPKGYRRLSPGVDVRLRYGYIVRCGEAEFDASGELIAVHCTFYENSRSGQDQSGVRTKGIIHWLPVHDCVSARVHLYNALFMTPDADRVDATQLDLNPNSLITCDQAFVEVIASEQSSAKALQFERLGYFIRDIEDTDDGRPIFNRTIQLRDNKSKK